MARRKQQPGVVLLMALLLLAAVTASTIGTAVTISRTTGQSANLDNFIIASFAGDSGLERALAIVKRQRRSGSIDRAITQATTALSTLTDVGSTTRGQFQGTVRGASDPIVIPSLGPDESNAFDILEYCQIGEAGCTAGQLKNASARYLLIKGAAPASLGPSCPFDPTVSAWRGSLEVSWILIDQNGESSCTGRYFIPTASLACSGTAPWLLGNIINQQGAACTEVNPKGFRVKVRALDFPAITNPIQETISNLTIESFTRNPITEPTLAVPSGLPSRIQIDVTGNTGTSKSIKSASVLWQLPASGLFNYVIFTEGDIIPN